MKTPVVRLACIVAATGAVIALGVTRLHALDASRSAALPLDIPTVSVPGPDPSHTPKPTPTPKPRPRATVLAPDAGNPTPIYDANGAIKQILSRNQGIDVSIAAFNLKTGDRFDYGSTKGMVEGSVVKLDIFLTALYQAHGKALSADQKSLAVRAMENSDNVAADGLFDDVGGNSGLRSLNKVVGLTSTTLDPNGIWGMSTTSAGDQLRLLTQLVSPGVISSSQQQYALGLMRQVEADQTWGVSAVADPHTEPALKNGWLSVDIDNGQWLVNSTGVVTVHGQTLLLAVLTQHNDDYDDGINLVEALTKAAAPAVVD